MNPGRGGYSRNPCYICGKRISSCGLGFVSHMRSHVRKGEARESYIGIYPYGSLDFEPVKQALATLTPLNTTESRLGWA